MRRRPFLLPFDYVLLALALFAATGALVVSLRSRYAGGALVVIDTPRAQYVYPLAKDADVRVPGTHGESRIVIEDGAARFADSPCANKICVHTGALRHNGDVAACLPNNVIAHIEAADARGELDTASR